MIPENFKQSLTIAEKQLPGFITENDNYTKFIAFLEAYYEWMAENGNIEERLKNLLNYRDIDNTLEEFTQFFYNEFLTYFPEKTLANKRELVKLSKDFYKRKSTASSFKFLFRALYNADAEVYNTRESILIASDGKWTQGIYLILDTIDIRYLRTINLKIFGETSKSIAKIERVYPKEGRLKFQITDIVRRFSSGEFTRVVDNDLNDVYFDSLGNIISEGGELLRSKVVGNVKAVKIDSIRKGKNYLTGDPVVFSGGLNPDVEDEFGSSAIAEVKDVTTGGLLSINVIDGSNGFRYYPNTIVTITGNAGSSGAEAKIKDLDLTKPANVIFWGIEVIRPYKDVKLDGFYGFPSNPTANANTRLCDAFEKLDFLTYPISSIEVTKKGKNYTSPLKIDVISYSNISTNNKINIKDLGILSPVRVMHGGFNYNVGDDISITGGDGIGAFAKIKTVDANGSITSIKYVQKEDYLFPLGGMGYTNENLPEVSANNENKFDYVISRSFSDAGNNVIRLFNVENLRNGMYISGNGIANLTTLGIFQTNTKIINVDQENRTITISSNLTNSIVLGDEFKVDLRSVLTINSVLGDGEIIDSEVETNGEIINFSIKYSGDNYVDVPKVSLRIVDVLVSSDTVISYLPPKGSFVYQSKTEDAQNFNFYGYFDNLIQESGSYKLRLYDFGGKLLTDGTANHLFVDVSGVNSKEFKFNILTNATNSLYEKGVRYYGDGTAKASAILLNGVKYGEGRYLNTDGFLSSDKVLESSIYNDFTYFLTAQKEFESYKNVVKNILHPTGTKLIGRDVQNSRGNYELLSKVDVPEKVNLKYILYPRVRGNLITNEEYTSKLDFDQISYLYYAKNLLPKTSNMLKLYDVREDLTDVYISDVISPDSYISVRCNNGDYIVSQVESVDDVNHIVFLKDHSFLTYYDVAYGYSGRTELRTQTICGSANENANLTLTAPFGFTFKSVEFASYGTPSGSCGNFVKGICHADSSQSIVESYLLGKTGRVIIPATSTIFGNPCFGKTKKLSVQTTVSGNIQVSTNTITITSTNKNYNLINNGIYSNTNHILDIIKPNDYVLIEGNILEKVSKVQENDGKVVLYFENMLNFSGTSENPKPISVVKNFSANTILIDTNLIYDKYLSGYGNDIYGNDIDDVYISNENGSYISIKVDIAKQISPLTYYTFIGIGEEWLGRDGSTLIYVEKV